MRRVTLACNDGSYWNGLADVAEHPGPGARVRWQGAVFHFDSEGDHSQLYVEDTSNCTPVCIPDGTLKKEDRG